MPPSAVTVWSTRAAVLQAADSGRDLKPWIERMSTAVAARPLSPLCMRPFYMFTLSKEELQDQADLAIKELTRIFLCNAAVKAVETLRSRMCTEGILECLEAEGKAWADSTSQVHQLMIVSHFPSEYSHKAPAFDVPPPAITWNVLAKVCMLTEEALALSSSSPPVTGQKRSRPSKQTKPRQPQPPPPQPPRQRQPRQRQPRQRQPLPPQPPPPQPPRQRQPQPQFDQSLNLLDVDLDFGGILGDTGTMDTPLGEFQTHTEGKKIDEDLIALEELLKHITPLPVYHDN